MDHRGRGHHRPPLGAIPPGGGGTVRLSPGAGVSPGRFVVHHERSPVGAVLDRPPPDPAVRSVWFPDVDRPTLVLGSTQPDSVVDRGRAEAAGVDVARRRTGGGAVLLRPGETVWADVFVPAADPLADTDVGRAFLWVGRAWARALADVGVGGGVVHEGAPRSGAWSAMVCFGGLGPGEITVGGAKVVGISQRRTRAGSLFQCGALVVWHPGPLLDVLALGDEERAAAAIALEHVAAGVGVAPARLVAAFERALPVNRTA